MPVDVGTQKGSPLTQDAQNVAEAKSYVHLVDDDYRVDKVHRVDDRGDRVLAFPGEHIVISEPSSDDRPLAFHEKRYRVQKVDMGPNGGSSVTVAEHLTWLCASVLARALNAEGGIAPVPNHPRGILIRSEHELLEQLQDAVEDRVRTLAELDGAIADLQDDLRVVRERIRTYDEQARS